VQLDCERTWLAKNHANGRQGNAGLCGSRLQAGDSAWRDRAQHLVVVATGDGYAQHGRIEGDGGRCSRRERDSLGAQKSADA
jgi:hypothetical protein